YFTSKLKIGFSPKFSVDVSPRTHLDEAQFARLAKQKAVSELPKGADATEWTELKDIGWVKRADVPKLREKARTATIPLLPLGDVAAAATPFGLFFGRIANFINGELWGRETHAPWAMVFPLGGYDKDAHHWIYTGAEVPRHPSQLYEATLEGVVLFTIIN